MSQETIKLISKRFR